MNMIHVYMNIGQPVHETYRYGEGHGIFLSPDGTKVATVYNSFQTVIVRVMDIPDWDDVMLRGHTSAVYSVAFSPDNTRVVTGADDNGVRIWDAKSGECLRVLHGHVGMLLSVAFSPDGRRVVSGAGDNSVRIWNAESDECLRVLRGHSSDVYSVAFSPDGTRVVSGSVDYTVRIWDAASGECVVCNGHTSAVYSVAFSSDGTRVVSGSRDETVCIWDASSGTCVVGPLVGHSFGVGSVAFSPDGTRVVSASRDKTVRIWDAASGQLQMKLDTYFQRTTVLFSSDTQLMTYGTTPYGERIVHAFNFDVWHLNNWNVNWNGVARNPVMYRLDIHDAALYSDFVDALSEYLGPYIQRLTPALNANLMRVMLSYVPHASLEGSEEDVLDDVIYSINV